MSFIIIEGNNGGYILYCRASKTLEVIATRKDKDGILDALRKYCRKFNSRMAMERYIRNYESMNTKQGIIYKVYVQQLEEEWNNLYKDIWAEKIESIISAAFPTVNNIIRRKFKVVR